MAFDLNSISKAAGLRAPRVLIYGPAGIGKTTFGAGAPNPVMLCAEDGLGKLTVDAFPLVTDFQQALDALDSLINEDHGFQSLTIDSLDHLEPLVWTYTCQHYTGLKGEKFDHIEDFGFGRGFMEALNTWRLLLNKLDTLRNKKQMAIILIAHAEIKRFESPTTDSYDRYQIKLHKRASDLIAESVDCIFFANEKTVIQKEKKGFGAEKTRGISTGQRYLFTQATPGFIAKNRYSLPAELPLSWQAFSDALMAQ